MNLRLICAILSVLLCACGLTQSRDVESKPGKPVSLSSEVSQSASEDLKTCEQLFSPNSIFDGYPKFVAAHEKFLKSRWKEASSAFDEALRDTQTASFPENLRLNATLLAGIAYDNSNNDEKALQFLSEIAEKQYLSPNAFTKRALRVAYRQKKYDDCVRWSKTNENDPVFQTYAGLSLAALGKNAEALEILQSVKRFPKDLQIEAFNTMYEAQIAQSNIRAALEALVEIFEIDPKSEQGKVAQGQILSLKDQWPADFRFPKPAKQSDSKMKERDVALAHFNAHRSEQAIKAFSKLLVSDKRGKSTANACDDLYYIARSYVKLRKHSESLPHFKEGIGMCENTDTQIKLLYAGGRAAWNAGDLSLALKYYDKITIDYPKHSYADDAMHFQAQILKSQSNTELSLKKLREQLSLYPEGDMFKDSLWMIFLDAYENKRWKEAIDFANENKENTGEDDLYSLGRLGYFKARAYEQMNEKANAILAYSEVIETHPLSYYAMIALGALKHLDANASKNWMKEHKLSAAKPEEARRHCFHSLSQTQAFSDAKTLLALGLKDEGLEKIIPLTTDSDGKLSFEAKLAKSIILQTQGKYTQSAREAFALIDEKTDLANRSYTAWLLAYPQPWLSLVQKASTDNQDLFFTIYAIMREESYYNPSAESWANARGLMQVMLPTAQSTAKEIGLARPEPRDLFKADISIPIGAAYIAKLYRILSSSPLLVLPGYNAGQGNVGKWMRANPDMALDLFVEKIPFKEARHYAKRVSTTLWRYRWLYSNDSEALLDPSVSIKEIQKL